MFCCVAPSAKKLSAERDQLIKELEAVKARLQGDAGLVGVPAGQFLLLNGNGATDTYDYNAESYAFFAHGTYYMDEGWSVTAGIRYSEEEKTSSTDLYGCHKLHTGATKWIQIPNYVSCKLYLSKY